MNTVLKNRISELENEIEVLEQRMLKLGSGRAYNNLKNEQWTKINELKKLKARLGNDSLQ